MAKFIKNGNFPNDINEFAQFTYDNGKVAGWGIVGGVCNPKTWRLTQTFDPNNILRAAKILNHEIGHTLAMGHDKTAECKKNSFMGDSSKDPKWSTCAVADFRAFYNKHNQRWPFCMPFASLLPLPKEMKLNVYVIYDKDFKDQFKADAEKKVDEIFKTAKGLLQDPSLGTKINANLVGKSFIDIPKPYKYKYVLWDMSLKIKQETDAGRLPGDKVNSYVLLSYNKGRIGGNAHDAMRACMVYYGRTCQVDAGVSSEATGRAMAKYIGNSLGMKFAKVGMKDKSGKICAVDGIMGKPNGPAKWTNCNTEDLQFYFNRYQPFCLS